MEHALTAYAVDSETARLREVLLCPPVHYRWIPSNAVVVETLRSGRTTDASDLARQHGELVSALEDAGVVCRFLDPEEHLPYQAYTRDSSQVTPWGPVLTQLQRHERRGEYAQVLRFYEERDQRMWRMASEGTLEGGDIAIIRPGVLAIGCSGVRTDGRGAAQLAAWFRAEGWEVVVERFPEHFLHLDVVFSMVTPTLALANEEVLSDEFQVWVAKLDIRTIPVTYRETMALGANVLALGDDRVISARHNVTVNAKLRAEGLQVLDPDLSAFTDGGGGPHCLTMPLVRDPHGR